MSKTQENARRIIRDYLLTQGDIAREMGIDPGHFSRWLNGARFEKLNLDKVRNWILNR